MRSKPPARGRPKIASPRQNVTLRFEPEQLTRLDAHAKKKGTKRSAIIQVAVAEYLERQK